MKLQQKTLKTRLLPAALAAAALVVAGCGGDGDGGGAAEPPPPPPVPTVKMTGVVLDGPLVNARVCLDTNDNRVCDAAEPATSTGADGTYELTVPQGSESLHPVIAEAIAGTTTDVDTGGIAESFTLIAPKGKGAVISPFTTLVQSELDGGRADNLVQAEENILINMVGTAGDTGGLTLYASLLPVADEATTIAAKRSKMAGVAQVLSRGFGKTQATSGLTGKELSAALGVVATGSLQQLLSQVNTTLAADVRDTLFAALEPGLVPSTDLLADLRAASAKTAAEPYEGAWVRTADLGGGMTARYVLLLAGDGTFVHQTLDPGVATSAWTPFDEGYGYRYGRYTFSGNTLTTTLIEASAAAGPGNGTSTAAVSGDTLTIDGVAYTRVASAGSTLVGGWVRPNGGSRPEYLVMMADGTYFHSTFYYQNDPKTGTASYFETAKSAGVRRGTYAMDPANANLVVFGETTMSFNGTLAMPTYPATASVQADGSMSMAGLRVVKLGTTDGAKAVTGLSEATRSRLWSGRYFSRTVSVGGSNRLQYVYVRGPADVLTFLQAPTGSDNTLACDTTAGLPDFTTVSPEDGKLKQFVIGTGTGANTGYNRRRLNVGTPDSFVSYTPITRPTNTTARCTVPQ